MQKLENTERRLWRRTQEVFKMEKKYGTQARIGERFSKEIEDIKIDRIKNGKSNPSNTPSTRKITDLIARHKHFNKIKDDIIELEEEKLNEE